MLICKNKTPKNLKPIIKITTTSRLNTKERSFEAKNQKMNKGIN